MRTVGIPVGSPMPVQDDNQQSAITSSSIAGLSNSVPPKERRCLFVVRGRLPQSFLSPQSKSLTRFTLVTLLFCLLLGNVRASLFSFKDCESLRFQIDWNSSKISVRSAMPEAT